LSLDELTQVDCLDDDCGSAASSAAGGTRPNASAGATTQGAQSPGNGGDGGIVPSAGSTATTGNGSTMPSAGSAPVEAGSSSGGTGNGSGGTDMGGNPSTAPCPGGPAPDPAWQEHWSDHSEDLTLRAYDDCVALYVDSAMGSVDTDWLSSFLTQAWTYNLKEYGKLGTERLYVVIHGAFSVGHASAFYESDHDGRNVIDAGANSWDEADYDRLARLLSVIVERTAVSGKRGSPGAAQWSSDGFAQIYTYDLYVGLAMDDAAARVWGEFEPTHFTFPVPNSYWFADFYYPTWRDHGKTKALVNFFSLLEKYYPAPNQVMGPMNWGEYIHFASGAAGNDLQEQATYAFGWNNEWQAQIEQARQDYSAIEY
jgi:hypothetical protein